jgi:phage-related baseplate assembly protein
MSVTGVQKAVVKGAETMGAGNVGVYISAINGTVSQELIQAVEDYINSVQPINATVIVNALTYVDMDVEATVVLKDGYNIQDVIDEFTVRFGEYLETVDNVVSYFKVSDLLYACSGVEDVTTYTLNNGTSSVTLADTDYAVVGDVEIDT